jgi:hypothetical protein
MTEEQTALQTVVAGLPAELDPSGSAEALRTAQKRFALGEQADAFDEEFSAEVTTALDQIEDAVDALRTVGDTAPNWLLPSRRSTRSTLISTHRTTEIGLTWRVQTRALSQNQCPATTRTRRSNRTRNRHNRRLTRSLTPQTKPTSRRLTTNQTVE